MLSKQKSVQLVIQKLETELASIINAAKASHEAATHEQSKPEDQYDTRGLEASYLASAQAKRADEIKKTLLYFKSADDLRLLVVESDARQQTYLVAKVGGGISINSEGETVQVITPDSPLGEEISDRKAGETFDVEIRERVKTYRVLLAE